MTEPNDQNAVDFEHIPTLNAMRKTLKQTAAMIDQIELANAIKSDCRIDALLPFRDWLLSGAVPHCSVRQMMEVLMENAIERKDKHAVGTIVDMGIAYLKRSSQ